MSETPPPGPPRREKLDIEKPFSGGLVSRGVPVFYAVITVALIGVALYMALVEERALLSGFVLGPAIGAVWFALRTFMTWGSNARG